MIDEVLMMQNIARVLLINATRFPRFDEFFVQIFIFGRVEKISFQQTAAGIEAWLFWDIEFFVTRFVGGSRHP